MAKQELLIGIAMRNGRSTIRRALTSIFTQSESDLDIHILIVDDDSEDAWEQEVQDYLLSTKLMVVRKFFGETWKVRNFILDHAQRNLSPTAYVARLDCDDELASSSVLNCLGIIISNHRPDAILMGNYLRQGNVILERKNPAMHLFSEHYYLLDRLKSMAKGDPCSELPSCNVVLKNDTSFRYPPKSSAEDHWLTVEILLSKNKHRIYIAQDIMYCTYSLLGTSTLCNKITQEHERSRQELLTYYILRST